jgi:serine protease Do
MILHDNGSLGQRRLARGAMLLAICLGLVVTATAQAQREGTKSKPFLKTNPKFLEAFHGVVARASQSTLRVQCDGDDVALGTIVGVDGWVLTKASDLKGKIVCKLKDGRQFEARLVGVHEGHDLAMLKIDAAGLTPVIWRSSKDDPVGNWVACAGPGVEPVAVGVISVAARNVPPPKFPNQRDPSASGYLGVGLEAADEGVKINEIMKDSAAAKAGLKVNDRVLSVSGKLVADVEALQKALQVYKPGDTVAVRIKRGDEELDVKAQLGKRPAGRADIQNNMGSELSKRRTGFPQILQHDSVVRPKDCGGPLVDLDGQVIGVNVCRWGRTETYAVPAEVIQPLLSDLMSGRLAPPMGRAEAPAK